MIELTKKHRIRLKTIAMIIVCLFTVNNLSWANPDIFRARNSNLNLQIPLKFWVLSDESYVDSALLYYLNAVPGLEREEHRLCPVIEGIKGKRRVDLTIDPGNLEDNKLTVLSRIGSEEYISTVDLTDRDNPSVETRPRNADLDPGKDATEKRLRKLRKRILERTGAVGIEEIELSLNPFSYKYIAAEAIEAIRGGKVISLGLRKIHNAGNWYNELCNAVNNLAIHLGAAFDHERGPSIDFAVLEVIKNAFIHGNHFDFSLPVFIHIGIDKKRIKRIEIYDAALPGEPDPEKLRVVRDSHAGVRGEGIRQIKEAWNYERIRIDDPDLGTIGSCASITSKPRISSFALREVRRLHPKYEEIATKIFVAEHEQIKDYFDKAFGKKSDMHLERFLIALLPFAKDPLNDPYFRSMAKRHPRIGGRVFSVWNFYVQYMQPTLDDLKEVTNEGQREAFRKAFFFAPRHLFVPEESRARIYQENRPVEIGEGQTISQATTVAKMSLWLDIQPKGGQKVLEVGTGSGWQAALLHYMGAEVCTVERKEALHERTKALYAELGIEGIEQYRADGTVGLGEKAPFDRIMVSAGAPKVPEALQEQIAESGKLICPVVSPRGLYEIVLLSHESGITYRRNVMERSNMWVPLIGRQGYSGEKEAFFTESKDPSNAFQYPVELLPKDGEKIWSPEKLRNVIKRVIYLNRVFIASHLIKLYPMAESFDFTPIVDAMIRSERHIFAPEGEKAKAYTDTVMPIGHEQYTLMPSVAAILIALCSVKGDDRVMVVGAGSGWLTSVISFLAKEVVAYELIPELAEKARENINEKLKRDNIEIITGDGTSGANEKGVFDIIIAPATNYGVPEQFVRRLSEGGRLAMPLSMLDPSAPGAVRQEEIEKSSKWTIFIKKDGKLVPHLTGISAFNLGVLLGESGFMPAPATGEKGPGKTENGDAVHEDGYIRKGEESWKEFLKIAPEARGKNDKAFRPPSHLLAKIMNMLTRDDIRLSQSEKKALGSTMQNITDDDYGFYVFSYIVKGIEDYVLGYHSARDSELFVSDELIIELQLRDKNNTSLAEEYVFHEIICPLVGHQRAILLQQKIFPEHYPDQKKLAEQVPLETYKGLLGEALRDIIDFKAGHMAKPSAVTPQIAPVSPGPQSDISREENARAGIPGLLEMMQKAEGEEQLLEIAAMARKDIADGAYTAYEFREELVAIIKKEGDQALKAQQLWYIFFSQEIAEKEIDKPSTVVYCIDSDSIKLIQGQPNAFLNERLNVFFKDFRLKEPVYLCFIDGSKKDASFGTDDFTLAGDKSSGFYVCKGPCERPYKDRCTGVWMTQQVAMTLTDHLLSEYVFRNSEFFKDPFRVDEEGKIHEIITTQYPHWDATFAMRDHLRDIEEFLLLDERSPHYAAHSGEDLRKAERESVLANGAILFASGDGKGEKASVDEDITIDIRHEGEPPAKGKDIDGLIDKRLYDLLGREEVLGLMANVITGLGRMLSFGNVIPALDGYRIIAVDKMDSASRKKDGVPVIYVNYGLIYSLKEDPDLALSVLCLSVLRSVTEAIAEKMNVPPDAMLQYEVKILKKYMFDVLHTEMDYDRYKTLFEGQFKNINALTTCGFFLNDTRRSLIESNKKGILDWLTSAAQVVMDPSTRASFDRNMETLFWNMKIIVESLAQSEHIEEALEHLDYFVKNIFSNMPEKEAERNSVAKNIVQKTSEAYWKVILRCKDHRPYLLEVTNRILQFAAKTAYSPSSRQLLVQALHILRIAQGKAGHEPHYTLKRAKENHDLMKKGLEVIKKSRNYKRTPEYYQVLGMMSEISIFHHFPEGAEDLKSFENAAEPFYLGRKGEVKNEKLKRDLQKLKLSLSFFDVTLNRKKGIRLKKEIFKLKKSLEQFKELVETDPLEEEKHVLDVKPLLVEFLAEISRIEGDLDATWAHLTEGVKMFSTEGEVLDDLAIATVPVVFFTHKCMIDQARRNAENGGAGAGEAALEKELDDLVGDCGEFFAASREVVLINKYLRKGQYDELIGKYHELKKGSKNFYTHLVLLLYYIWALAEKKDGKTLTGALLDYIKLSDSDALREAALVEVAAIFKFLPEAIKGFVGESFVRILEEQKASDEDKKLVMSFLRMTRDDSFYRYLKRALPPALEAKGDPWIPASEILDMMEYFCSPDLYRYFMSEVDIDAIGPKALRDSVKKIFKRIEETVSMEPGIFIPKIAQSFESGAYREVIEKSESYLKKEGDILEEEEKDKLRSIKGKAQNILHLLEASSDLYAGHKYADSVRTLEEALSINPSDANMQSMADHHKLMHQAEEYYSRKEMKKAVETARAARGSAEKGDKVPEEFLEKVEKYKKAEGLMTDDPDAARNVVGGILSVFRGDSAAEALLKTIEARIFTRQQLRSQARIEMKAGNHEQVKNLWLEAIKMGKKANGVRKEAFKVLGEIYEKTDHEISLRMSEELLEIYPEDAELEDVKNRSAACIVLAKLRPHLEILNLLLLTQNHQKERLRRKFGGMRYAYGGIEFKSGVLVVRGLKYIKSKKSKPEKIRNSREIAFKGDTFRFVPREAGEKDAESVDYFEVVETNGDTLTFAFDNIEQQKRAMETMQRAGFIEKGEDISLIRQKEALDGIVSDLEKYINGQAIKRKKIFPFLRMNTFAKSLLGLDHRKIVPPGSADLPLMNDRVKEDESQIAAIRQGINPGNKVTLIQGPPGTGKTTTIAEIVNYYIRNKRRVLVVSQSNAAVNNVAERLKDEGVVFVRVGNREEKISDPIKGEWECRKEIMDDMKKKYLKKSRKGFVVLGTNNGFLNDKHTRNDAFFREFDVVIVEEAGRATVAETLVPVISAREKVILVGDHKQLPAFGIASEIEEMIKTEIEEHGLRFDGRGVDYLEEVLSGQNLSDFRVSLFERAFRMMEQRGVKLDAHTLLVNRRSHPLIVGLVNLFYNGILKPRDHKNDKKEKAEDDTLVLIDAKGKDVPVGTSPMNKHEVDIVLDQVVRLMGQRGPPGGSYKYQPEDITIISPYLAQNEEISLALKAKAVIDRIRTSRAKSLYLTDEEKKILRASLKKGASYEKRTEIFINRFINNPFPKNTKAFLKFLRFRIPTRGRTITLGEVGDINIAVSTVDSIQGQENKVTIVSFVWSNDTGKVGYLGTQDGVQRVNVSLSRAQEKLIMIGDFENTLTRARAKAARDIFTKIRDYVKEHGNYSKDKHRQAGGVSHPNAGFASVQLLAAFSLVSLSVLFPLLGAAVLLVSISYLAHSRFSGGAFFDGVPRRDKGEYQATRVKGKPPVFLVAGRKRVHVDNVKHLLRGAVGLDYFGVDNIDEDEGRLRELLRRNANKIFSGLVIDVSPRGMSCLEKIKSIIEQEGCVLSTVITLEAPGSIQRILERWKEDGAFVLSANGKSASKIFERLEKYRKIVFIPFGGMSVAEFGDASARSLTEDSSPDARDEEAEDDILCRAIEALKDSGSGSEEELNSIYEKLGLSAGSKSLLPAISPATDDRGNYIQAEKAQFTARRLSREWLDDSSLAGITFTNIGLAAYELAANCIKRGGGGVVLVEARSTDDDVLFRITARDMGDGIGDVEGARKRSFEAGYMSKNRGHGFREITGASSVFRKGQVLYRTNGAEWTFDPEKGQFEITGKSDIEKGTQVTLEITEKQLLGDSPTTRGSGRSPRSGGFALTRLLMGITGISLVGSGLLKLIAAISVPAFTVTAAATIVVIACAYYFGRNVFDEKQQNGRDPFDRLLSVLQNEDEEWFARNLNVSLVEGSIPRETVLPPLTELISNLADTMDRINAFRILSNCMREEAIDMEFTFKNLSGLLPVLRGEKEHIAATEIGLMLSELGLHPGLAFQGLGALIPELKGRSEREYALKIGMAIAEKRIGPWGTLRALRKLLSKLERPEDRKKAFDLAMTLAEKRIDPFFAVDDLYGFFSRLEEAEDRELLFELGMTLAGNAIDPWGAFIMLGELIPEMITAEERRQALRTGISLAKQKTSPREAFKAMREEKSGKTIFAFQKEKDTIETKSGKELQDFTYELNPQMQSAMRESLRGGYPSICGIAASVAEKIIKARYGDRFKVKMRFGRFRTIKYPHAWLVVTDARNGDRYYLSFTDGQFAEYPGGEKIDNTLTPDRDLVSPAYVDWYTENGFDYVTFKEIRGHSFVKDKLGMTESDDQEKARSMLGLSDPGAKTGVNTVTRKVRRDILRLYNGLCGYLQKLGIKEEVGRMLPPAEEQGHGAIRSRKDGRAWKKFQSCPKEDITDDCIKDLEDLLARFMSMADLLDEDHAKLRKLLEALGGGEYKIYGFDSIVTGEEDYVLGWHNPEKKELYLALDLMDELRKATEVSHEYDELLDEYTVHELVCPMFGPWPAGHYRAIFAQQTAFSANYQEKNLSKGLLGHVLRQFIAEKLQEAAGSGAEATHATTGISLKGKNTGRKVVSMLELREIGGESKIKVINLMGDPQGGVEEEMDIGAAKEFALSSQLFEGDGKFYLFGGGYLPPEEQPEELGDNEIRAKEILNNIGFVPRPAETFRYTVYEPKLFEISGKLTSSDYSALFDYFWNRNGLNMPFPGELKAKLIPVWWSLPRGHMSCILNGQPDGGVIAHLLNTGIVTTDDEEKFLWKQFHIRSPGWSNRSLEELTEKAPKMIEMIKGEIEQAGRPLRVLELGCGEAARALRDLKALYKDKIEASGVDFHIPNTDIEGVDLREVNLRKLPFEDNSFDVIYEYMALDALKRDQLKESISEAMRVLAPGGKLFVSQILGEKLVRPILDEISIELGIEYEVTGDLPFVITRKVAKEEKKKTNSSERGPPQGLLQSLLSENDISQGEVAMTMIKPDAGGKEAQIIADLENMGFEIIYQKKGYLSVEQQEKLYAEHEEKPFYGELKEYISSGPATILVLRKKGLANAWEYLRKAIGPTDCSDGLRKIYGTDRNANAMHASDSFQRTMQELLILLDEEELDSFSESDAVNKIKELAESSEEVQPTGKERFAAITGDIDLWGDERVIEIAKDLRESGLKNFYRVDAERAPPRIRKIIKYGGAELFEHKNGLRIIKKKPYRNNHEMIKNFCKISTPSQWCPTFSTEKDKRHYFELDLIPFGYVSFEEALGGEAGGITDGVRDAIRQIVSESARRGDNLFIHRHLHAGNILLKLDDKGDVLDIRPIDLKFLIQAKISDYPGLVSLLSGQNRDWRAFDLTGAHLEGFDFKGFDLSSAVLRYSELAWADLREVDLTKAVLMTSDLTGADLRGAILKGASLAGAKFEWADLRGAHFEGADLSEANFFDARFSAEDMRQAKLRRTMFNKEKGPEFEALGYSVKYDKGEDACYVTSPASGAAESLAKPESPDMAKRLDAISDGDSTNPLIIEHIKNGRAIELDEKEESAERIRLNKDNKRDLSLQIFFKSNGTFEKISQAKDPSLLKQILEQKQNFRNLAAQDKEKIIEIAKDASLSFILGRVLIATVPGRNEEDEIIAHARTGAGSGSHRLAPTIWIGEILFNRLSVGQLAQLLLEEAQHILKPPAEKEKGWTNMHGNISEAGVPAEVIEHDKEFIGSLDISPATDGELNYSSVGIAHILSGDEDTKRNSRKERAKSTMTERTVFLRKVSAGGQIAFFQHMYYLGTAYTGKRVILRPHDGEDWETGIRVFLESNNKEIARFEKAKDKMKKIRQKPRVPKTTGQRSRGPGPVKVSHLTVEDIEEAAWRAYLRDEKLPSPGKIAWLLGLDVKELDQKRKKINSLRRKLGLRPVYLPKKGTILKNKQSRAQREVMDSDRFKDACYKYDHRDRSHNVWKEGMAFKGAFFRYRITRYIEELAKMSEKTDEEKDPRVEILMRWFERYDNKQLIRIECARLIAILDVVKVKGLDFIVKNFPSQAEFLLSHLKAADFSSANRIRLGYALHPKMIGNYRTVIIMAFPELGLDERDFILRWRSYKAGLDDEDVAIENVRYKFKKYKPRLYYRWLQATKGLLGEEEKQDLREEFAKIEWENDIDNMKLSGGLRAEVAPHFKGSVAVMISESFRDENFDIGPLDVNFELPSANVPEVKEYTKKFIRHHFSRHFPDIYAVWEKSLKGPITFEESILIRKTIVKLSEEIMKKWEVPLRGQGPVARLGLRAIDIYAEAFNAPYFNLESRDFRLAWNSRAEAIENIRFKLSRFDPGLFEKWKRISRGGFSRNEENALREELGKISNKDLVKWDASTAARKDACPYFNGSVPSVVAVSFRTPQFELEERDLYTVWNPGEEAVKTVRHKFKRYFNELYEGYLKLAEDPDNESLREALKLRFAALQTKDLKAIGLRHATNSKAAPCFKGKFFEVIHQSFPFLMLSGEEELNKLRAIANIAGASKNISKTWWGGVGVPRIIFMIENAEDESALNDIAVLISEDISAGTFSADQILKAMTSLSGTSEVYAARCDRVACMLGEIVKAPVKEASLPGQRTALRDLLEPRGLSMSLIDALLSKTINKKVVLAFDRSIGGIQKTKLLGIFEMLKNLKKHPQYEKILKNLEIVTGDPGKLHNKLQKHFHGENTEIFIFGNITFRDMYEELKKKDNVVSVSYIDEKDFPLDSYYPLVEIVTITLAQSTDHIIPESGPAAVLRIGDKQIKLSEMNIDSVSCRDRALVFKLLPSADPLNPQELIKRYAELKRFLKAA